MEARGRVGRTRLRRTQTGWFFLFFRKLATLYGWSVGARRRVGRTLMRRTRTSWRPPFAFSVGRVSARNGGGNSAAAQSLARLCVAKPRRPHHCGLSICCASECVCVCVCVSVGVCVRVGVVGKFRCLAEFGSVQPTAGASVRRPVTEFCPTEFCVCRPCNLCVWRRHGLALMNRSAAPNLRHASPLLIVVQVRCISRHFRVILCEGDDQLLPCSISPSTMTTSTLVFQVFDVVYLVLPSFEAS